MKKQLLLAAIWVLGLVAVVLLMLLPVQGGAVRLGMVLGVIFLWIFGLFAFWKNLLLRILFGVVGIIAVLVILLPGRGADAGRLRNAYLDSLSGYEGVKYVYGGENRIGIDCSALVREAYVEAILKTGLMTLNPGLLRRAFFVWWHDSASDALMNGYQGMTVFVEKADSMDQLDYARIKPGDIMVAEKSLHTIAYLGNDTWIEADPAASKVVKVSTPVKARYWKRAHVQVVRWREL